MPRRRAVGRTGHSCPNSEQGRPLGAEIFLEFRVERDVARIVQEQVELDLVIAWPRQQRRVEGVGFGRHLRAVRHAKHVLEPRRLGLEEFAQRRPIGIGWLVPVFLDRVPALAQTLFISIAILRNDRYHALRMSEGEAEADRRAVIEDVDRISLEADGLGEGIDDLGQIIERVFELRPTRGIRETKAQQIWCDYMVSICEQWDQAAEHM